MVREAGGARGGIVQAVSGVSFDIAPGETLGVVGETGSGKSTLARAVLQAPRPKSGTVLFRDQELTRLHGRALVAARRDMQFVLQDPFGSLDPKWQIRSIIEEPLVAHGVGNRDSRRKRVSELLDLVGLDPARYAKRHAARAVRRPGQRVAIARAVALEPSLLICDEAVSSLDVLIQAQVLNLFERLRRELSLSYLFIAHDLALVKQVSDRVAVMYLGKFVEVGPGRSVYKEPLHPYTRALLDSIPSTEPGAAGRPRRCAASRRPRSARRPAAGSAPAARAPSTAAPTRRPSRASWPPATWWPATSRSPSPRPGPGCGRRAGRRRPRRRRRGPAARRPHRAPPSPPRRSGLTQSKPTERITGAWLRVPAPSGDPAWPLAGGAPW